MHQILHQKYEDRNSEKISENLRDKIRRKGDTPERAAELLQDDSRFAGKGFTTDENIDKIECITKILQDITGNVRKRIRWICEE